MTSNNDEQYSHWLAAKAMEAESFCRHCGACCGAFEDPCDQLLITPEGRSHCRVYAARFGVQKTVSGQEFNCIPIRQKTGTSWPGDEHCGYKQNKQNKNF